MKPDAAENQACGWRNHDASQHPGASDAFPDATPQCPCSPQGIAQNEWASLADDMHAASKIRRQPKGKTSLALTSSSK
jgi:hypothetical protein